MWKAEKFCSHSGQYNDGYEHAYEDTWSAEQTGTSENGIEISISRYYWGLNWAIPAMSATFSYGSDSVTTPAFPYWLSEGYYRSQTKTEKIVLPNSWAGKTINWSVGNYSGTLHLDGYGQFLLTLNADPHVTMKVERTASPKAEAKTGILNNKATLYTGDELTVRFSVAVGYDGSVELNGNDVENGHTLNVLDNVTFTATAAPKATMHLYLTEWSTYLLQIFDGEKWGLYQALVYDGSEWSRYY